MKRFEIISTATGAVTHRYEAEEEMPVPPGDPWGLMGPYSVQVTDISTEYALRLVQQKRAFEYPPLQDLADAIVHERNGNPAPMQDYIARCLAVKSKYPKP